MNTMCKCSKNKASEEDKLEYVITKSLPSSFNRRLCIINTIIDCSLNFYFLGQNTRAIERIEEMQGIYEGEVEEGEKHGLGCYMWYNGNFYNGEWKKGKIAGYGKLYYSNGGVLKGNFVDGRMNGLGRGVYKNGDMYIGLWENAMFHGAGLFYMKTSNQWQIGKFENGTMTEISNKGQGKPSSLGEY